MQVVTSAARRKRARGGIHVGGFIIQYAFMRLSQHDRRLSCGAAPRSPPTSSQVPSDSGTQPP